MVRRSVVRSKTQQPPVAEDACCDWLSSSDEPKAFRYVSACCCPKVIGGIVGVIVWLCFIMLFQRHNGAFESALSHLRASVNRLAKFDDFELRSPAFEDGQAIPSKYNTTVSPPLRWSNSPEATQSYVLILEDIDTSNRFKHWILYNMPSRETELTEGVLVFPPGTVVLRNDHQHFRYDGPSPRDFHQHRFEFRLFALSTPSLTLPSGTGKVASYDDLQKAMKQFILKEARLGGTYSAVNHN